MLHEYCSCYVFCDILCTVLLLLVIVLHKVMPRCRLKLLIVKREQKKLENVIIKIECMAI